MVKVIRSENLKEDDFGVIKVTNIINSEDWPFSIAKVKKVGNDLKKGVNLESSVAYYVLEGKGTFIIEKKEYNIKKGDCILIPKGIKYNSLKGLTLLAISLPRYDKDKRIYDK